MIVVLDECLPKKQTKLISTDQLLTVPQIGLTGSTDSDLLDALNAKCIDIYVSEKQNFFRLDFIVPIGSKL